MKARPIIKLGLLTISPLVFAAAVWAAYLFLQGRWVAQLYCARHDEIQVALDYMKVLEATAAQDEFLTDLYREEIESPFRAELRKIGGEFRQYADHLGSRTSLYLDALESLPAAAVPLSERLTSPCVYAIDRWMRLIPKWPSLPPPTRDVDLNKIVHSWRDRLEALRQKLPKVRAQIENDKTVLCQAADNARKARETLEFYSERCTSAKTPCPEKQRVRLTAWVTEQESDLQLNAERFTIKWGPTRLAQIPCMKVTVNESATASTESAVRATDSVGR